MSNQTPITNNPICYGQTIFRTGVQEWYETAGKHAGLRARQLRKAGFRVSVASMGYQVTNVGHVRMSLLNAAGDIDNLPAVQLERI